VNGALAAEWQFANLHPRVLALPIPAAADAGADLRVAFRIRHPMSPLELGLSLDGRKLGIMLRRLESSPPADASPVVAAPAPAPASFLHAARRLAGFRWV
jgi:hypothetical protein